jgi:flagellar protein FlaJ
MAFDTEADGPKTAQGEAGHRDRFMQSQVEAEQTFMTRFDGVAYSRFGDFFGEYAGRFGGFEELLDQARMPIDTDLYLSRTALATILGTALGYLLVVPLTLFLVLNGTFDGVFAGVVPAPVNVLLVVVVLLGVFGLLFLVMGWGAAYAHLQVQASSRKRALERQTPFAVTFMFALSRGGMNFVDVIKTLSESGDAYGTTAEEFESIVRDMEYLSIDLQRALRRGAMRTPSPKLENFLDDIVSVIDSGADLTTFLDERAEEMLREAENEQENFLNILSLLGQVYVTAFVAGPVFLIIVAVVRAMIGGGGAIIQLYGIVYALLPLMNVGFYLLIDTLTIDSDSLSTTIDTDRTHESAEETRERFEEYSDDSEAVERVLSAKADREKSQWRREPLTWLLGNPMRGLAVGVPLALAYLPFAVLLVGGPGAIATAFLDPAAALAAGNYGPVNTTAVLFVVPLLLSLTPVSIAYEVKSRRRKKMLTRLPDALKQLASSNEIGMTLTESLQTVSENTSGKLGEELQQVGNDISWYNDVNGALVAFANRVRLAVVARTVKLITEANQSTGDIAEVLTVAAKDVSKRQKLKKDRANEMLLYTVVVIISFIVYLFVIATLDSAFLSEIAQIGESSGQSAPQDPTAGDSGGQQSGLAFSLGDLPVERFRMLFYHSTVIQALGSGLMAGKLGTNEVLSGLKFSLILIMLSTGLFIII